MIPEKSIFISDVPSIIHWHKEPSNYDTDEGIYYRLCSELLENYKILRSQEELKSNEGMGLMLSGFFYRACVIFLYVALRYRPNQINIRILWKLCEYADHKVKNLDYLIQKLPFDFFEFLNPSKNLYRNFCYLDEEHLSILDELAQGFLDLVDKQFEKQNNKATHRVALLFYKISIISISPKGTLDSENKIFSLTLSFFPK